MSSSDPGARAWPLGTNVDVMGTIVDVMSTNVDVMRTNVDDMGLNVDVTGVRVRGGVRGDAVRGGGDVRGGHPRAQQHLLRGGVGHSR